MATILISYVLIVIFNILLVRYITKKNYSYAVQDEADANVAFSFSIIPIINLIFFFIFIGHIIKSKFNIEVPKINFEELLLKIFKS